MKTRNNDKSIMQPDIKVHCTIIFSPHISQKQYRPTYKNLTYHKSLNQSGKDKWYWGTNDSPFWKTINLNPTSQRTG